MTSQSVKEEVVNAEVVDTHVMRLLELPSWKSGIMRLPIGSKIIGFGLDKMKRLMAMCLMSDSPRLVTYQFQVVRIGDPVDLAKFRFAGTRQMDYEILALFVSHEPHLDSNDDVAAGF